METEKKPERVAFKMNTPATVGSVRLPNPMEAARARGHFLCDIILSKDGFYIGSLSIIARKPTRIGMKFEAVLCFRQVSEDEFLEKQNLNLIPISDKHKDAGIV